MSDERDSQGSVNPHTGKPWPAEDVVSDTAGTAVSQAVSGGDAAPGSAPGPASTAAPAASGAVSGGSATPAPSQQELAIRVALETVMDPEIGLSVIDLGLIREVLIQPGKTLVRMMLTTPFCPYAPQIMADVKLAARSVLDQECEVEFLPDPWSPELMPDPGLLGFSY